jgi:hypothetical protein
MLPRACAAHERRGRGRDLQFRRRLARTRGARAQLLLGGRHGARFIARTRIGARAARQAHHLSAGRRQFVDEPRVSRHDRRGRAEESGPYRRPERNLRGKRFAPDPERQGRVRRHGARGRLCACARVLGTRQFRAAGRPRAQAGQGRYSPRSTSSVRSRSPTIMPTSTIRRGARRSKPLREG